MGMTYLLKATAAAAVSQTFTGVDQFGDTWSVTTKTGAEAQAGATADPTGSNNASSSTADYGLVASITGAWRGANSNISLYDIDNVQCGGGNLAEWQVKLSEFGPYWLNFDSTTGKPPVRLVTKTVAGGVSSIDVSGINWPVSVR